MKATRRTRQLAAALKLRAATRLRALSLIRRASGQKLRPVTELAAVRSRS